jgi:hypothetical protein
VTEKALLLLENAYSKFLMKDSTDSQLCRDIEIALNSLPFDNRQKEFTVQIVNQKMNEKFFGMRVFPKIEKLDEFCKDLINGDSDRMVKFNELTKRWKTIDSWFLELDIILFDRNMINFTPKELVALTLHEIGHIIYSDKPIEGFYRAYREAKVRMNVADRATQKLMYNIYMIPLSVACMQRRWVNERDEIHVEIIADKTVIELGYGNYLVEAFNKIIRRFGSINSNKNQQQAEIDTSVQWCNKNISDIIHRKDKLKDELYYQAIRTKSNYMKAITIITLDKIGLKMRERYTGAVVENSLELLSDPNVMKKYIPIVDALESAKFDKQLHSLISSEEIAMEAFFNRRKKIKTELPSQYEVDAIAIEVDKITNHHDRLFVIDLIFELKERISIFEEAISPDPALVRKWSGKINMMNEQLEHLRHAVLEKKTFASNYKFFVKLPEEAEMYSG